MVVIQVTPGVTVPGEERVSALRVVRGTATLSAATTILTDPLDAQGARSADYIVESVRRPRHAQGLQHDQDSDLEGCPNVQAFFFFGEGKSWSKIFRVPYVQALRHIFATRGKHVFPNLPI